MARKGPQEMTTLPLSPIQSGLRMSDPRRSEMNRAAGERHPYGPVCAERWSIRRVSRWRLILSWRTAALRFKLLNSGCGR